MSTSNLQEESFGQTIMETVSSSDEPETDEGLDYVSAFEYKWRPCLEREEFNERWDELSRSSSSRSSASSFSEPQPNLHSRGSLFKRLFGPPRIITSKPTLTTLMQETSPHRASTFKAFTTKELKKATNNYREDRIIGTGICSTVYKGVLEVKSVVAVKKFKVTNEQRSFEFRNEIFILSKTNHVNVVKLLGWCSEIEVPILVLEYIPNGTLFQLIHGRKDELVVLPLDTRLRIAAEIAEALAYLHTAASPPILHGNVKSPTILLDANYTVKVYSFGISILESNGMDGLTTPFRGRRGYLDPEYKQSGTLTDRSDVYSFGVVLLELLTRKKAIYYSGTKGGYSNLAKSFVACTRENRLLDILDPEITKEGLTEQIQKVTNLAALCLRQKRSDRPTMKEVHMQLEASRVLATTTTTTHSSVPDNTEDIQQMMISHTSKDHKFDNSI